MKPEAKREYNRRYYEAHHGQPQREYHQRIRREVLMAYGGSHPRCTCCGQDNERFLVIDHINGGGQQHRREIGRGYTMHWLRRNNYPPGFQVLCHNCNQARAFYGQCCVARST